MKAIDVYAGIGGWSAGLTCAGVEVVGAYEVWPAAVRTYNANLGTSHSVADVRKLDFADLPKGISLVVGSPPCTEFSFANRGGAGDITKGIKDIVRFFEIVEHIKPTYWLMENVPRIAAMVREGLNQDGHVLHRFQHLAPEIRILDLSDFGIPQCRTRCLVGIFPFERLLSFGRSHRRLTLGEVITALGKDSLVTDPVWGIELEKKSLTEMEPEPALNAEQLRMNREAKCFHPVYNDMAFPDALDRPSRTVTATCTRVSRESIVVADEASDSVRRLTVRERATLQGFPVTYQFFGRSHSQKVQMIGNAIPPYFAYLVGAAAKGWRSVSRHMLDPTAQALSLPVELPDITLPHSVGTNYPARRRFRAALPGLRFKTGMRFQLSNEFEGGAVSWLVSFSYGPSKAIRSVPLDEALFVSLTSQRSVEHALRRCRAQLDPIGTLVASCTSEKLQESWRQCAVGTGPYHLADLLGHAALALTSSFALMPTDDITSSVLAACAASDVSSSKCKIVRNASAVLAGLLLGSWFNRLRWGVRVPETGEGRVAFLCG